MSAREKAAEAQAEAAHLKTEGRIRYNQIQLEATRRRQEAKKAYIDARFGGQEQKLGNRPEQGATSQENGPVENLKNLDSSRLEELIKGASEILRLRKEQEIKAREEEDAKRLAQLRSEISS